MKEKEKLEQALDYFNCMKRFVSDVNLKAQQSYEVVISLLEKELNNESIMS